MKQEKSRKLFGTDGIRGIANQHPMVSEVALSLGRALACFFQNDKAPRKILIGKDTRLSGYMLETALCSGITSMGVDVLLVGPMPTAGVAYLTRAMRASAGVMISASHNPFQDNGIKVFDGSGFKLADEKEEEIESLIQSSPLQDHAPSPNKIGKAYRVDDASGRYCEYLKGTLPREETLEGMRLVLDCAHGAAYQIAPTVFQELGAEVKVLGAEPDGLNINHGVGALHPEKVAEEVKKRGANLGLALDGDADRAVFVDEEGRVVEGDAILALCALELMERGTLRGKAVVGTVMSNLGLEKFLEEHGVSLIRTAVGDRYVIEKMRQNGALLGGESSGHIIFREYSTTGDGILAGLQIMASLRRNKKPLSQLRQPYQPYPQVLKNVRVRKQVLPDESPVLRKKIREVEESLGTRGRVLVRLSGTEPVMRVMLEGRDRHEIERLAQEIASVVERVLNSDG